MNTADNGHQGPSDKNHEDRSEKEKLDDKRTPWSGNLSNAEISRPGGLLLAALVRCTNERGLQLSELAKELGVTYGYINQLRNGIRKVTQVSDEFTFACAKFLGIPRLTVLMLAERVTQGDLFEPGDVLASQVSKAIGFVCDDKSWGHLITPELRSSSEHSRFAIVKLYEAATGMVLMDKALQFDTLTTEIARIQSIREEQIKQVATVLGKSPKQRHLRKPGHP